MRGGFRDRSFTGQHMADRTYMQSLEKRIEALEKTVEELKRNCHPADRIGAFIGSPAALKTLADSAARTEIAPWVQHAGLREDVVRTYDFGA